MPSFYQYTTPKHHQDAMPSPFMVPILLFLLFTLVKTGQCDISVVSPLPILHISVMQVVTVHPSATVSSSLTFAEVTYTSTSSQNIVVSTLKDSILATSSLPPSPISTTEFPTAISFAPNIPMPPSTPFETVRAVSVDTRAPAPSSNIPRCDQSISPTCTETEIQDGYLVGPQSFNGPKEVHRPKNGLTFRFWLNGRKWQNSKKSYLRIILKRSNNVTVRRYYVVIGSGDVNINVFWGEWLKNRKWVVNNSSKRKININVPLGSALKGFYPQCCYRIVKVFLRIHTCKNGNCSYEFIISKRNTLPCEFKRPCK